MVVGADGRLPLPWLQGPLDALVRHPAHALLIHGPGGSGEFPLAVAAAQAWLCEIDGDGTAPCGRCPACRLVQAGTHADLRVCVPEALRQPLGLDAADEDASPKGGEGARSKAKPSRMIRVDEVRAAIEWAQQTPARGRGKVLVLYPAEAMNDAAANALLKTLEEPPGRLRLLLATADEAALLPTVRSRCQRVALHAPSAEAAAEWLVAQGLAGADVLLAAAGGRPLEALALQAEGLDAAFWQRLPMEVKRGDASALAAVPPPRVIDLLTRLCHDLLAGAVGAAPRFFPAGSLPPGASIEPLTGWASTLRRLARHADHPWNAPLLIESLVLEGARCWPGAPPPAVARHTGVATLEPR